MDATGAISLFKKGPQPQTGPRYGSWENKPEIAYGSLPGGGMLAFDLNQLTLADFDAMRYHPQINASLSVLTFMIHQADWRIECEDQKIADMVEDNLGIVWTRLVRAMSQAFWAGFSPCVLEYENDPQGRYVVINKVKDLSPHECDVHWKKQERQVEGRQRHFYTYDGIDQYGWGSIPAMNSLWYPVLMENGNHRGRKLLKSAFMPWYFSQLMHIYTNRYYERFGEPLPIGRAPFEDEIVEPDGTRHTGKQIMEDVIAGIRSRAAVVLPSDKNGDVNVGSSAYDYDVQYLESQLRGVDFERYMTRLDEEMSLALFTPLLLLRNADVGSHNLGVQHTQCVHPDTPILCADMVWRPARDLKAGQEIVAFDEDPTEEGRGKNARSYRTAVIDGNMLSQKASMRLTTDIGDPIEASVDHPWLVWRRQKGANRNMGLVWAETQELVVGDQIAYFGAPWVREESRDAGWLAGIFDGEGTLVLNRSNHGHKGRGIELTISQNPGPVLDKIKQLLGDRGFTFSEANPTPTGYGPGKCMKLRLNGGFPEVMRFLGTIGPERMLLKAAECYEGRGLRKGYSYELATVTSIEDIGMNPISSIKTSGGTFITGGYLSHNTWLWELNALLGDMKEYIDRYICERLKSINFSPNAPRVEWVPRKMGKESVETTRAIITELIRGDKAGVDLDELGVHLGMSVKQVRQVTQDPAQQEQDPAQQDPQAPEQDNRQRTERTRANASTRTVGRDRVPGTRTVTARVRSQAALSWESGVLSIEPLNKFERSALQHHADRVETVIGTLNGMPVSDFDTVDDVVAVFTGSLGRGERAS